MFLSWITGVYLVYLAIPIALLFAGSFVIALPLTFSGLIVAYGFILGYGRAGLVTQLLAESAWTRRRWAACCSRRWGSPLRRRTT